MKKLLSTEQLNKLCQLATESQKGRRQNLIERMDSLSGLNKNCYSCTGLCCTFEKNSMQVTPLQLLDVYNYLVEKNRIDSNLLKKLADTITMYRLDSEPAGDGRRVFARRRYTCNFYSEGPKGCGLSRESKPYGCLAFNAYQEGVVSGEGCSSDQNLLQAREEFFSNEDQLNIDIGAKLALSWKKQNLPFALYQLLTALGH